MIPLGDPKHGSGRASETVKQEHLEARDRAAKAAALFPASQSGRPFGDFTWAEPATLAQKVERSVDQAVSTAVEQMEGSKKRFDALPLAIQKAAHDKAIDHSRLDLLEVAARLHRASKAMGGERAQVFACDVGRSMDITSLKAEALMNEAVSRGFVARTAVTIGGGTFKAVL